MLACAFCAVSLSAAEMKIAVIDMGRVFQEYSKTKINEAKLKKQAEIFKDYSTRLSDQLKKLQEEFKDLRDASQNMAFTAAERENRRLYGNGPGLSDPSFRSGSFKPGPKHPFSDCRRGASADGFGVPV